MDKALARLMVARIGAEKIDMHPRQLLFAIKRERLDPLIGEPARVFGFEQIPKIGTGRERLAAHCQLRFKGANVGAERLVDEADALRLLRSERLAGLREFRRNRPTDAARQRVGPILGAYSPPTLL
jgi:hypothetical protein